jgi:hypothetical protein
MKRQRACGTSGPFGALCPGSGRSAAAFSPVQQTRSGACLAQRSRLWAALGGAATEVAIVVGFYASALVDPVIDLWAHFALPYPGLLTSLGTGLSDWLSCISSWGIPAIAAGVVYGLLGRWLASLARETLPPEYPPRDCC